MQILKFKSVDSYAYGDTQLIYFVEIRDYLRRARAKDSKIALELVLISLGADEIQQEPQTNKSKKLMRTTTTKLDAGAQSIQSQFPPLFQTNQTMDAHGNIVSARHNTHVGGGEDGINRMYSAAGTMRMTHKTPKQQKKVNEMLA